jgi:hypothetical protein
MTAFVYRDLRRKRVEDALAALDGGADPDGLRPGLERELRILEGDDWMVTDRAYRAVAADSLWATRVRLRVSVAIDPALRAVDAAPALTDAQAAAIEGLEHGVGTAPPGYLNQVDEAIGNDEAILAEMVHAAHRAWLDLPAADSWYPFADVGVLLPLRLETLFDPPLSPFNDDPTRWKLSLRVVPDEASICRDDPHVSDGELAALRTFWSAVRAPGPFDPAWLDGAQAGVAWGMLAGRVTPARAAWLAATVLPVVDGDELLVEPPADMQETPQPNRVGGLPPRLSVWGITVDANGVETRHDIGSLPMDTTTRIGREVLALPMPSSHATARDAWWASWPAAVKAGLGGEWLLGDGLAPDSLAGIHVAGLSDEPPDEHFRAQADSGELGVLRLGSPTNTIHGAPAADLALDDETWRRVARARIGQRLDPDARPAAPAGDAILLHLAGSTGTVPFFPGADLPDETLDSQRMAQALWPALHGQWLAEIWGVRDDAFRVARWAFPFETLEVSQQEVIEVLHRPCEDGIRPAFARNLCPEGPLMPLRIGDQPYGLLPVTCLADWQPSGAPELDPEQPRVEGEMARALVNVRAAMAATGRRNGNVVGASTERFMELLSRDAVTRRYIARMFAPASVWALPFPNVASDTFENAARDLYRAAAEIMGGRLPEVPYLANGAWRSIRLPLVRPTRTLHRFDPEQPDPRRVALTWFLGLIVDLLDRMGLPEIFERVWPLDPRSESHIRTLPDSLLIRLLVHSCQVTARWLSVGFGDLRALPVLLGVLEAVRDIGCELDQPTWNGDERDPDTGEPLYRIQIPADRTARLEGALRATIDTAAHRIDPWVTGFAWQRLRESALSERGTHRLGAYGWVDGPFIGTPGPTAAGRLHAPSYNQALAAVVLRDRFLSAGRVASASESGRNPWEMNISSRKARLAEELADEVRLGFHIYEIVGRRVEHVVATHQAVKALRTSATYAMRADRRDPNEVCNGIDALAGLLAGDPDFPLDDAQRAELHLLRDALDTYGDLLVADGVMQLVNRQADRAAETMDAAAGFSRPPTFEFLRTPASGYQLDSLVLGVAAYVPPSAVEPDASPIRIAEPSLGAFLETRLGSAWVWTAVNDDEGGQLGSTSLADMSLGPLDALALSADFLADLARRTLGLPLAFVRDGRLRAWDVADAVGTPLGRVSTADLGLRPADLAALDEAALQARITGHLRAPADSVVSEALFADPREQRVWIVEDADGSLLGIATLASLGLSADAADQLAQPDLHRRARVALGVPRVRVDAPAEHELARHFVAALGDRPAAGRDVVRDPATQRAIDGAVYVELVERYTALHRACQVLFADLRAAPDDAARTILIRRALGWGVTVMGDPMDREALFAALTGAPAPEGSRPVRELAEATAVALEGRLKAAPTPADLVPEDAVGTPLPDHEERKRDGRPDGIPSLARAIATLASPQGRVAILACWPRAALLASTNLETDQPDTGLDEAWLTVVAAVRPALARLEALQLELDPALGAWTSSPGDPWRTGADAPVQANRRVREETSVAAMSMTDRLAAAYGTPGAWQGEKVAVGLIDAFGESIPMPHRSTVTAFGFNAPAARPPQAILLAVPPKERQRLDDDLVQRMLAETRELAHARTVRVEDLGALQALTPTAWMTVSGNDAVRLEPYPLFD